MSKSPASPTEPFKRALAQTVRSMGETAELEVAFSGDGSSLTPGRLVLPHPKRDLPPEDVARIRGLADRAALKLAHHDPIAHSRARPLAPEAQVAFDAMEQARLEAIGANVLAGVRGNLNAALEAELEVKGLSRFLDRVNAPMHEGLALMARQKSTEQRPPRQVDKFIELFRGDL